jgi:hypothetical protein
MDIENVTIALLLVLSAFLAVISALAYYRGRTPRMGLVVGAFLLFLLKSALLAVFLFREIVEVRTLLILTTLCDSLALSLLYLGVLKR